MAKEPKEVTAKELREMHEWFRSSDEVRTGYVSGDTFGPREVEYSVVDGQAIFEGDISLGQSEAVADTLAEADPSQQSARGIMRGVAITGEQYRWPRGRVPYEIDGGVPNTTRTTINNAIQHWEQNTNIRFIERTPLNARFFRNYVQFFRGTGCWSQVGMRGNMQQISIGAGCGFGAAVHEIGHAVGLWHEQSREDRDRHVRIHWGNIQSGREHNFNQRIADGDDIGPYDCDSIMHYGQFAFSSNGQQTIEPLTCTAVGQRNGLSAGDIAAVRALYPQLEPPPQTTRLFRYWGNTDHFYTTSWNELGSGRHGWVYEGVQCYIHPNPATGSTPLFRYYNGRITDHFYTTNFQELRAGAHGWVLEGIQGYVYPRAQQGTVPLYRYWNPKIGDHFYTTSWSELGQGRHGWKYEGVQCHVYPLPPAAAGETDEEAFGIEEPVAEPWSSVHEPVSDPEGFLAPIQFGTMPAEEAFAGVPEVAVSWDAKEQDGGRGGRGLTLRISIDE